MIFQIGAKKVVVDDDTNDIYIRFTDNPVKSTKKITDDIYLDLDQDHEVIGIEILQ